MKHKVLYSIIIVGCIVIVSLWYFPAHTWSARLMDGASGLAPIERAIALRSGPAWELGACLGNGCALSSRNKGLGEEGVAM